MDIYLDDKTSLMLVRAVATNKALALVPTSTEQPTRPSLGTVKLDRLGIPSLLGFLQVPDKRPLGLVVPRPQDRIRSAGIDCVVDAMQRSGAPFLQLASADPRYPSPLVPPETNVLIQHPAQIALSMARRLRRLMLKNKLSPQKAVLMMVKLCLELCGTYALDPFDPLRADAHYGTQQRLTSAYLQEFLRGSGTEQGLLLAREAADLTYDLSGSPQESFMGPALFFDQSLGGLAMCDFIANKTLDLTPSESDSIGHRIITPDFQLPDYNAVVEYLGEIHNEGDNPRIDHVRSLDYQTLGKREFCFWYADVDSKAHFARSAERIVSVIAQHDGPEAAKRFRRLMRDPEFLARQNTLFEVYRPWLRTRPV